MRRVFLLLSVMAFLVQVASWPLFGVASASSWPPLSLVVGILAALVLLETRGPRVLAAAAASAATFGVLFPGAATGLTRSYGFAPGVSLAGVAAAWMAFLLLALALADQLRWLVASRLGRWSGAWLGAATLAALELAWDPALLAEGALWSHAPSLGRYPWGYTPGFVALHMLVGWGFMRLVDRMEGAGRQRLRDGLVGGAALAGTALILVLLPAALPLPELAGTPAAARVLLDLLGAAGLAGALGAALRAALPTLLPRAPARVLLTTPPAPVAPYPGGHYPLDFYSSRSSRDQGPWTGEVECPYLGAHLMANNLEAPCVVLEYPSLELLEEELREVDYQVVGIGFTVVSRESVRRVCQLVRRLRPRARVVVGGYGVVCLPETQAEDPSFTGLVDEVCHGEGVSFLRRLLGEDPGAPLDLRLPVQRMFPLGLRLAEQRMLPLVAGFGCDQRCGFCGTSAFFEGRNLRLGEVEDLARAIEEAAHRDPTLEVVALFDEDFLADRARLEALRSRLDAGGRVPPGRVALSVFSSLSSLQGYAPEELVRLGVGYVWVGVESKFTNLRKCGQVDVAALLGALEAQGICLTLSWILGFDFQTPENLGEDLEWLVGLPSVTAQVSLLGPLPGTPLHRQLTARGRLLERPWELHHLYEECMNYLHFAPGELAPWVDRAYRALYRRRGPSLLRTGEVWYQGYRRQRDHEDPALAARAVHLGRGLRRLLPVLLALGTQGELPEHRQRARALLADLGAEGITPEASGVLAGLAVAALVAIHRCFLASFGLPARQPRPVRTEYPGSGAAARREVP